jgi:ADP-L-glycero-D-manno-heptose 6-epimerase
MKRNKILITGTNGFVGRNLKNSLSRDDFHIYELNWGQDYQEIPRHYSSENILENFLKVNRLNALNTTIVHLGANTNAAGTDAREFAAPNIHASKTLFRVASHLEIPLIFASSSSVYGPNFSAPTDETGLRLPPYAQSKWLSEIDIENVYGDNGKFCVLRFFNIYGLDESSKGSMVSIPYRFVTESKRESRIEIWQIGNSEAKPKVQSRDFIYVDDVITIIRDVINDFDNFQGVFDLGTGISVSFQSIAETISMDSGCVVASVSPPKNVDINNYQMYTQAGIYKPNLGSLIKLKSMEEGLRILLDGWVN